MKRFWFSRKWFFWFMEEIAKDDFKRFLLQSVKFSGFLAVVALLFILTFKFCTLIKKRHR